MAEIPIKATSWMKDGDFMFIQNGVEAIARLDGTKLEVKYPIKKAKFAIYHKGKIYTDESIKEIANHPLTNHK